MYKPEEENNHIVPASTIKLLFIGLKSGFLGKLNDSCFCTLILEAVPTSLTLSQLYD